MPRQSRGCGRPRSVAGVRRRRTARPRARDPRRPVGAGYRGVTSAQRSAYAALLARRAAREPLQHLTGSVGFRHVELVVGPGVFVPRPETELLAGWAVDRARECEHPVVVDLCTGSGAIALAVAHEAPHAQVYAVELDERAWEWAARNLAGSGVELRHGDMATAFDDLAGLVDVVTCNPPYIPLEAWESVAPGARDHDRSWPSSPEPTDWTHCACWRLARRCCCDPAEWSAPSTPTSRGERRRTLHRHWPLVRGDRPRRPGRPAALPHRPAEGLTLAPWAP
ncbi:MAG: HemK/PrmC family methyltransferase [Nocardioides sp.]